jgi:hypothetical protein
MKTLIRQPLPADVSICNRKRLADRCLIPIGQAACCLLAGAIGGLLVTVNDLGTAETFAWIGEIFPYGISIDLNGISAVSDGHTDSWLSNSQFVAKEMS